MRDILHERHEYATDSLQVQYIRQITAFEEDLEMDDEFEHEWD
jgi:hypothetical protein